MKLNYPQKESGLYILSREDIENIAEDVLKEFFPQNLILPKPLDTAELLEDRLGLTVKQKYIGTLNSAVLGLIVMSDEVEIPSYDEMYKPTVLRETYGTVLINKHLCVRENTARRRYTETHEGAHFILHGEYFKTAANSAANRKNNSREFIACRKVELYGQKTNNDSDWMEWQADSLAAALLMPGNVFCSFARSVMRKYGITGRHIVNNFYVNKGKVRDIISDIARAFNVSYRAAQIRMLHLGLITKG